MTGGLEIARDLDRPGVAGVYRMICEVAKERQVFVITHDRNLLDMLRQCDTIEAVRKNGETRFTVHKGGMPDYI